MSIKLKEIIFSGFKSPKRNASVNFVDGNISIIYGTNGVGKTSLLKGIYAFLKEDENYLKELKVHQIVCRYCDETNQREKTIKVGFSKDKNYFDWDDFKKSELANTKSLSISIDRNVKGINFFDINATDIESFFDTKHSNSNAMAHLSKTMKKNMSLELLNYFKNVNDIKYRKVRNIDQFFLVNHVYIESLETQSIEALLVNEYSKSFFEEMKKVNTVLSKTLNSILHSQIHLSRDGNLEINLGPEELLYNREKLISSLSLNNNIETNSSIDLLPYDKDLRKSLMNRLKNINNIKDAKEIIDDRILSRIYFNLIQEFNRESELSKFNRLLDKFNEKLIENKKITVTHEKAEIVFQNGDTHSLEDLSSGEKHLLVFLVCVLFKCEGRDFLFIDEPEMSLNTGWQRELLELIHDLVPDTQVIVASHSPFIVEERSDYLNELVVKYVK